MVFDKVKEIIAEQLYLDEDDIEQITLETSFAELGMDSIDAVDILVACEDEYDIEITDEDFAEMNLMKDLVECIQARI